MAHPRLGTEIRSFAVMTDEEIVALAKNGDEAATHYILKKYRGLVEGKARNYFLAGADRDDVIQEAMIGLYKAVRDYNADKLAAFHSFAELCITRQIITAVKTASRQKHTALNTCLSLEAPAGDDDSSRTLGETIGSSHATNPERMLISKQFAKEIIRRIKRELSDLEADALQHYLDGKSYQEIARCLGRHMKQIDNALQRAKRKIARTIEALHSGCEIPEDF